MPKNSSNVHVWGDTNQAIYTAPLGATAPTAPPPTAMPANWLDIGWVTDTGLTESRANQETKVYGWQGNAQIRVIRSQFELSFKFQAAETSLVTYGLMRPGKSVTTVAGTAEVQTITLTGTGTAGTWSLTMPYNGIIGGTASALAYNIATAALATALNTAFGATGITVTGTPGSSYVVTIPALYGDAGLMTAVNAITGVSAIGIVTTTPGVATTYSQGQGSITSNRRQFAFDIIDGAVAHRYYVPNGEASVSGDIALSGTAVTAYEFTVAAYADASGNFYYDLTNDPSLGSWSSFA